MKIAIFLSCIFLPFLNAAQNVGIGTTTPGEKLEIKNPLRSTVKISAGGLSDTTQLTFSNTGSTAGLFTEFSIKSVREEGLFFSSNSDLASNTSSNSLVIRPGGNIGLGINLPAYRLQVNEPVAASTYMSLTNPITGSAATDGLVLGLTGNSGILYNLENSSLQLGTNGNTRLMIEADGDVGIGTISPTAKLHINGGVKLEGLNLFEFGANIAGKELNAGKVGYNAFGTNALAFVGAGTSSSNRAVYFFAEGGTTFSGPATVAGNVNIGGQLQMNGNAGTSGQILRSNGASDPTWANAALSNTTRFAASIPRTFDPNPLVYSTIYNLNPADVTISSSTITINKTGLYHFEGFLVVEAVFTTQPPAYLSLNSSFSADGEVYDITNYAAMDHDDTGSSNFIYRKTLRFENDVHISAPATIGVGRSINYTLNGSVISSRTTQITISGYLISE